MKYLSLNSIGTKGLNADSVPWELPPEFITDCKNIRIDGEAIKASGGKRLMSACPTAFYPGFIMPVANPLADYFLVAGRTHVFMFDGVTWHNISSKNYALSTDTENAWTGCMIGPIPVVCHPQTAPEYWSPQQVSQKLQVLPFDSTYTWEDKQFYAKIIRSHKNFLFALNLEETGVELRDSLRWSHPADSNGIPASWDETDAGFLAGKHAIGANSGSIIDGRSLRDSFVVYSENGVNIFDYTGDEFVWRNRILSAANGLLTKNCIAEVKGAHFFLGDGDVLMNDGNSITSIVQNKIRKRMNSLISAGGYQNSFVVKNNAAKEIWFCVAEESADYPSTAYIYSWVYDSWTIRELVNDNSIVNGCYGPYIAPSEIWDTLGTGYAKLDAATTVGSGTVTPP